MYVFLRVNDTIGTCSSRVSCKYFVFSHDYITGLNINFNDETLTTANDLLENLSGAAIFTGRSVMSHLRHLDWNISQESSLLVVDLSGVLPKNSQRHL
jgi:hypothetical protein